MLLYILISEMFASINFAQLESDVPAFLLSYCLCFLLSLPLPGLIFDPESMKFAATIKVPSYSY